MAGKQRQLELEARWRSVGQLIMMGATAMAGFFFLLLPIWRRDAQEHFWCGCFLLLVLLTRPITVATWMLEGVAVPLVMAFTFGVTALQYLSWERLFSVLLGVQLSAWGRRCQQGILLFFTAGCVLCLFLFDWISTVLGLAPVLSQLGIGRY